MCDLSLALLSFIAGLQGFSLLVLVLLYREMRQNGHGHREAWTTVARIAGAMEKAVNDHGRRIHDLEQRAS